MPESNGNVYLSDLIDNDSEVSVTNCLKKAEDKENGIFFKAENLSGTYIILFPNRH